MSYYVEHGAHFINFSEYRIAGYCYNPVQFLNSAVISFKSAASMHQCVCLCACVFGGVCIVL